MNIKNSKISFRVDASTQIGTGHFIRCLTLADELKQRGALVRFVSCNLPVHLCGMLVAKKIEFVPLQRKESGEVVHDLTHSHWLGASQALDAQATIQALSDHTWNWLIVDHYALDERWERALRHTCDKIFVIDDLADRQHDCDLLLDPNFYVDLENRYAAKVPDYCRLLLGPSYALLRDEFRRLREQVKIRTGQVRRIMVFFGGIDVNNYTERTIHALSEINIDRLIVDVVVGLQHSRLAEIEALCLHLNYNCHVQTDRMAELMARADLAIGAGGSTVWERCCLGLPALTICAATNQEKQVADAASAGFLFAPDFNGDFRMSLQLHLRSLMENSCLRQLVSSNAMQAVDVRGISRIVRSIGCSGIDMRIANENDSRKLFEWRNHSSVRAVSRNAGVISWENHQKWLATVMMNDNKVLLIGEREGRPIGVVRFEQEENYAEISVYLVPDTFGLGYGQDLLACAEQWIVANKPNITHVRACVLGGNIPSKRLFLRAGYQAELTNYLKIME